APFIHRPPPSSTGMRDTCPIRDHALSRCQLQLRMRQPGSHISHQLRAPPYTMRLLLPPLVLLHVAGALSAATGGTSHEQLNLRPLPLSSLLASFDFRSTTPVSEFEAHDFRLFPRSLGQILQHVGTREMHLRFNMGRWDAETWGARPWEGTKEGGTGVE